MQIYTGQRFFRASLGSTTVTAWFLKVLSLFFEFAAGHMTGLVFLDSRAQE
jgi:hypothetical protein